MKHAIDVYGPWLIHTLFLFGQSFLAFKAQSDPRFAWIMPALGIAQSTFPSPLQNKPTIPPTA